MTWFEDAALTELRKSAQKARFNKTELHTFHVKPSILVDVLSVLASR